MILLHLLILLFSFSATSVTETQKIVEPNRDYLQFFLKAYLPWHEKSFGSKIFKVNLKNEERFLSENLKQIDHWIAKEFSPMDQLLIGMTFLNKKPVFEYQMYVHPTNRNAKFIQNLKLPSEVIFVRWDDFQNICFLTKGNKENLPFKVDLPKDATNILIHYCRVNSRYTPQAVSFITKIKAEWPSPFIEEGPEERTYNPHGLDQIFYRNKNTHIGLIPRKFYHYINTHGIATFLPFDKYSTDKDGNLTIYYP